MMESVAIWYEVILIFSIFFFLFGSLKETMLVEDADSSAGLEVSREHRKPTVFKYWKS